MADTVFYKQAPAKTIAEIAEIAHAEIITSGKEKEQIENVCSIETAGATDICFFYDKKNKALAEKIKAKACITTKELQHIVPDGVIILVCENPKLAFINLVDAFYQEYRPKSKIEASAHIAASAKVGKDCYIGHNVVIEEEVVIGDNCVIEANVVISRGCQIGNNCRIANNASIAYCLMGNDCYVYTGARIGQDGFGFSVVDGRHKRIPQIGRVIIGNDVEVGANTCIDRGALDDTIIGDGTRIDNLVQVAHNNKIGRCCILVSQTGIAGSCTLGDYVVCGGQVGLADHLNIGSGVQIGAQSGVMRDIDAGAIVMGTPTVPFKDFMRQVAFLQKNSKK
ncbi:UDP-3-O-(3-hydroxymyristoyl)glucosamine N-acyltransferase [bacterium]|nr:UDP-3-O-(3-hydroxymyristoyl)glucosamine N-acyltransferase [bacterium]MBR2273830.1 UDP-3-O-(3-hydroxymyristoyl)glucosamine N-acyltransferase [Alphaproteobacteria bacterium]